MEVYCFASTAVHDIWTVTVFIRQVVREMKRHDDTLKTMQVKLEHEFVFLETFKSLFFDDEKKMRSYNALPSHLTADVDSILSQLSQNLNEYRILAQSHNFDLSNPDVLTYLDIVPETQGPRGGAGMGNETSNGPPSAPLQQDDIFTGEGARKAIKFEQWLKSAVAEVISRARDKSQMLKWALFTKEKMESLVEMYGIWSEKLRQVLTLMLLLDGRVGSLTQDDLANRGTKEALGLRAVAARQIRAQSDPPAIFQALRGAFTPRDEDDNTAGALPLVTPAATSPLSTKTAAIINIVPVPTYQVGTFVDEFDDDGMVVIRETHMFDTFGIKTSDEEKQSTRTLLIRKLAWFLAEGQSGASDPSSSGIATSLLPCLGYMEANGTSPYPSLLYRLPLDANPGNLSQTTLHSYMLRRDGNNRARIPSLGDRFFIAWSLASAVFSIHSSGWVHKNIWSRGILVFEQNGRPVPHLVGWTMARPLSAYYKGLSLEAAQERAKGKIHNPGVDLEAHLYRHPDRYLQTVQGFDATHDLYSLGVILLEIGLWRPLSELYKKNLELSNREGTVPSKENVLKKHLDKSRGADLAASMGKEYSRIVLRCLETDFEVREPDDVRHTGLIVSFTSS